MARDYLTEAKENYKDASEFVREQYERIREDFRFSNPSEPQQWDSGAITARKGRPMHTLDRTNQFVQHVVNKHRESKISADVLPVDSNADPEVAKKIKGIIRHIEYASKADIAWDTASDHQARGGLGWVRVLPKVTNPETNEQDIIIQRVHDPLSCVLDPNSTEPDGSDAMFGFAETTLTYKTFERLYPKAKKISFDTDGWFTDESVRIAEYFRVVETSKNQIVIDGPAGRMTVGEDEYWQLAKQIGYKPNVMAQFIGKERTVKWCKLSGAEVLEETDFPSQWIGIVPIIGHEIWVDGKRYLCGLVRRLMDGQKLHNFEMSALTESLMSQPKAPFLLDERAIEGHEDDWQRLNSGNPAFLPYNGMDSNGQPVNAPIRLSPPNFPVSYANTANLAVQEMEASVGMYKAAFGQQSNAISGRAKLADQSASDTATFHFLDNRRVGQEQVYRIVVDMLPKVYDSQRQARILGEDGQQSTVQVNPNMPNASQMQGGKVVAINLNVGKYDVRVKVGPSYTTIREETTVRLQEMTKANPMLASVLTPIIMELSDMPEADKIERIVLATLPPEVQKAYHADDNASIPPAAQSQIDQQGQQIEQMGKAMDHAGQVIQTLQQQVDEKNTKVQDEAKIAMEQIKSAQKDLKYQADLLASKERELADQKRIVSLEMQLQGIKQTQQLKDTQTQLEAEKPEPDETAEEKLIKQLADSMAKMHDDMTAVVEENTKAISELQQMTLEGMQEVTKMQTAPRSILRNAKGEAVGVQIGDEVRKVVKKDGKITGLAGS